MISPQLNLKFPHTPLFMGSIGPVNSNHQPVNNRRGSRRVRSQHRTIVPILIDFCLFEVRPSLPPSPNLGLASAHLCLKIRSQKSTAFQRHLLAPQLLDTMYNFHHIYARSCTRCMDDETAPRPAAARTHELIREGANLPTSPVACRFGGSDE